MKRKKATRKKAPSTRRLRAEARESIRQANSERLRITSERLGFERTIQSLERRIVELRVHENASRVLESIYLKLANVLHDDPAIPERTKREILDLVYYGRIIARPLESIPKAG